MTCASQNRRLDDPYSSEYSGKLNVFEDFQTIDAEIIDYGIDVCEEDYEHNEPRISPTQEQMILHVEDEKLTKPKENISENILYDGFQLKAVSIKIVDCNMYPWYYPKYKNRTSDGKISDAAVTRDAINELPISIDLTASFESKEMETKSADKVDTCKKNPCHIQSRAEKTHVTSSNLINENKILKHKEILTPFSQIKSTIVDFKRNKGLVGMKVLRMSTDESSTKYTSAIKTKLLKSRNKKKKHGNLSKSYVKAVDKTLRHVGTTIIPIYIRVEDETVSSKKDKTGSTKNCLSLKYNTLQIPPTKDAKADRNLELSKQNKIINEPPHEISEHINIEHVTGHKEIVQGSNKKIYEQDKYLISASNQNNNIEAFEKDETILGSYIGKKIIQYKPMPKSKKLEFLKQNTQCYTETNGSQSPLRSLAGQKQTHFEDDKINDNNDITSNKKNNVQKSMTQNKFTKKVLKLAQSNPILVKSFHRNENTKTDYFIPKESTKSVPTEKETTLTKTVRLEPPRQETINCNSIENNKSEKESVTNMLNENYSKMTNNMSRPLNILNIIQRAADHSRKILNIKNKHMYTERMFLDCNKQLSTINKNKLNRSHESEQSNTQTNVISDETPKLISNDTHLRISNITPGTQNVNAALNVFVNDEKNITLKPSSQSNVQKNQQGPVKSRRKQRIVTKTNIDDYNKSIIEINKAIENNIRLHSTPSASQQRQFPIQTIVNGKNEQSTNNIENQLSFSIPVVTNNKSQNIQNPFPVSKAITTATKTELRHNIPTLATFPHNLTYNPDSFRHPQIQTNNSCLTNRQRTLIKLGQNMYQKPNCVQQSVQKFAPICSLSENYGHGQYLNMQSPVYNTVQAAQSLVVNANMPSECRGMYTNNMFWPYGSYQIPLLPPPPPPPPPPLPPDQYIPINEEKFKSSCNNISETEKHISIPSHHSKKYENDAKEGILKIENTPADATAPYLGKSMTEDIKPVSCKTEMLAILEQATKTIISPIKPDLKRSSNNNETDSVKKYKPGPLSKKLTFYNSNPSTPHHKSKQPNKSTIQYSPPILPIPTYQNILSKAPITSQNPQDSTDNRNKKSLHSKNINRLFNTNDEDVTKKISLEEYKMRILNVKKEN